jgi:hypothetical protein
MGNRQALGIKWWLGMAVLLCSIPVTLFVLPDGTAPQQSTPRGTSSDLSSTQTKSLGNWSITLTITPGKINVANTVTVQIRNRHSGQSVMNAHVMVSINMDQMDMGTTQATMTRRARTYSTTIAPYTAFSMTGIWDITLTIQLPQQVQSTIFFQVWLN